MGRVGWLFLWGFCLCSSHLTSTGSRDAKTASRFAAPAVSVKVARDRVVPITIRKRTDGDDTTWISEGIWDLNDQLTALTEWLNANANSIAPASYIVEIAFAPRIGGAESMVGLDPSALGIMSKLGIELRFSEHPESIQWK